MSASRNSPRVILSHAGRQHSYKVAAALQSAGVLELFLTSSYYKRDLFPERLARLVPAMDRWLQKRSEPSLDPRRVRRFPLLEVPEVAYRVFRGSGGRASELVAKRDMSFDDSVSRVLLSMSAAAFWGFQGSCYRSLKAARERGMVGIAEFSSVPVQVSNDLLNRDLLARGEVPAGVDASRPLREYCIRQEQEPAIADICVAASSFTARSLESIGVPPERIRVIPLGVDVRRFAFRERQDRGALRVLFVGKLGRHKGLAYLLEAMDRLRSKSVSLTLAGPSIGEDAPSGLSRSGVRLAGALDGERLLGAYEEHDVLVLPSLYEGFGLVIVEAMASGMPVIATANSCAPDVVREGLDGFVIPAFDADAIAGRIDWFASNRAAMAPMGRSASSRAQEYSWERHAQRVGTFIEGVLSRPTA